MPEERLRRLVRIILYAIYAEIDPHEGTGETGKITMHTATFYDTALRKFLHIIKRLDDSKLSVGEREKKHWVN